MLRTVGFAFLLIAPFLVHFGAFDLSYRLLMALGYDAEAWLGKNFPFVSSGAQILLVLMATVLLRHRVDWPRLWFGVRKRLLVRDIVYAIVIAIIVAVQITITLTALESVGLPLAQEPLSWPALVWWVAVASFTAGIGEELYFRASLFERLKRLGSPIVLIFSSASFAVWHIQPAWFIHTFISGLIFGLFYLKIGRVFPLVLGHALTNLLIGILMISSRLA